MKTRITTFIGLVLIGSALLGCNTVKEVGQDIQRAGSAVERAAR